MAAGKEEVQVEVAVVGVGGVEDVQLLWCRGECRTG